MEKKKQQHSSVKIDRQATQDFYCQNAACSNEFFSLVVRLCSALEETLLTKQLSFAAYFILRGHGSHIDFLRLLFLVGMICPLIDARAFV